MTMVSRRGVFCWLLMALLLLMEPDVMAQNTPTVTGKKINIQEGSRQRWTCNIDNGDFKLDLTMHLDNGTDISGNVTRETYIDQDGNTKHKARMVSVYLYMDVQSSKLTVNCRGGHSFSPKSWKTTSFPVQINWINECASNPCIPANSTCKDQIGGYYCICKDPFLIGPNCSVEVPRDPVLSCPEWFEAGKGLFCRCNSPNRGKNWDPQFWTGSFVGFADNNETFYGISYVSRNLTGHLYCSLSWVPPQIILNESRTNPSLRRYVPIYNITIPHPLIVYWGPYKNDVKLLGPELVLFDDDEIVKIRCDFKETDVRPRAVVTFTGVKCLEPNPRQDCSFVVRPNKRLQSFYITCKLENTILNYTVVKSIDFDVRYKGSARVLSFNADGFDKLILNANDFSIPYRNITLMCIVRGDPLPNISVFKLSSNNESDRELLEPAQKPTRIHESFMVEQQYQVKPPAGCGRVSRDTYTCEVWNKHSYNSSTVTVYYLCEQLFRPSRRFAGTTFEPARASRGRLSALTFGFVETVLFSLVGCVIFGGIIYVSFILIQERRRARASTNETTKQFNGAASAEEYDTEKGEASQGSTIESIASVEEEMELTVSSATSVLKTPAASVMEENRQAIPPESSSSAVE